MSYIYEYAGNKVKECASVIAQSIEVSDDKCVLEISLSCLLTLVQIIKYQDTQTELPYEMKFRLLKAIFNSLDRYSSVSQLESFCYITKSIIRTSTPEQRRTYECHHFINQILQHASAFISSSSDCDFVKSVWNCLQKLTEIGKDECLEFVRSSGTILFQNCLKMFPSEDRLLFLMTGKNTTY